MKKLLVLILLVLTACSPPVRQGTVIDKLYEPRRFWFMTIMVNNQPHLIPQQDDEDWLLVLTDGEKRWDIEVTQETFNSVSIGDYFEEPVQ